jgi:hypothetical protein
MNSKRKGSFNERRSMSAIVQEARAPLAPSIAIARCEGDRVSDVDVVDTILRAAASAATFVALEAEARGLPGSRTPEVVATMIATALMPSAEDDEAKRKALTTLLLPFVEKNLEWQPPEKETHP